VVTETLAVGQTLQTENERLQTEVAGLQAELAKIRGSQPPDLEPHADELQKLQEAYRVLESGTTATIGRLQAQIAALEGSVFTKDQQISDRAKEIQRLKEELQKAQAGQVAEETAPMSPDKGTDSSS